ncbi:MAG: HAD-IC family P-type ATPase, partial [Dehalococcoidia bacterium]|nr:HAD-IC family P-type ATPase [Dehalococcoidia bacterium]
MNDLEQLRWHQLEVGQVLARLQTGKEGLSPEEAADRLRIFGYNELAVEERTLPLEILLRQIQSPLIYILLAAGVVTAVLRQYVDTGVILAVVVLNSVVGFVQEYRAEQALRALARMAAPKARVLRAGEELEIDPRDVVPGDVILLESGVKVPADLRLFRTLELQADESVLTGESLPVAKTVHPVPDPNAPLGDQVNMAFMGTNIVRGRGAGIAVATGMQTALGHISAQMRQVGEVKSPLQLRLSRFAQIVAILVIAVTALVFSLGLITGESLTTILLTAIATAVATVP